MAAAEAAAAKATSRAAKAKARLAEAQALRAKQEEEERQQRTEAEEAAAAAERRAAWMASLAPYAACIVAFGAVCAATTGWLYAFVEALLADKHDVLLIPAIWDERKTIRETLWSGNEYNMWLAGGTLFFTVTTLLPMTLLGAAFTRAAGARADGLTYVGSMWQNSTWPGLEYLAAWGVWLGRRILLLLLIEYCGHLADLTSDCHAKRLKGHPRGALAAGWARLVGTVWWAPLRAAGLALAVGRWAAMVAWRIFEDSRHTPMVGMLAIIVLPSLMVGAVAMLGA